MRSRALLHHIRICILEKFGGIWIDTTIILDSPLPDAIFDYPFWSVKNLDFFPYSPVIPGGLQWQIYAIAAQPDALFYNALRRLFEFYVREENGKNNYFFVYYLSEILRRDVPILRNEYEQIKSNNAKCEQIQPFLSGWKPICRQNPDEVFASVSASPDGTGDAIDADGTFLYKMSSQIDLTNIDSADKKGDSSRNSRASYIKKRFLTAEYDSSAYSPLSDLFTSKSISSRTSNSTDK